MQNTYPENKTVMVQQALDHVEYDYIERIYLYLYEYIYIKSIGKESDYLIIELMENDATIYL